MRGRMRVKRNISKTGRLLGVWVPKPVVEGITTWIGKAPERDISMFMREAAREKLRRDGVEFSEDFRALSAKEGK